MAFIIGTYTWASGGAITLEKYSGNGRYGTSFGLYRTDDGSTVDFKTSSGEDYDCRWKSNGSAGLQWFTGGNGAATQRMEINSSRCWALGVAASATYKSYIRGVNTATTDYAVWVENLAGTEIFSVRNDGQVRISTFTTGSSSNLYVDSNGIVYRSTSSRRYKKDIEDSHHGLNEVLQLRSVKYKHNSTDKVSGGLIAEEVHDLGLTEFIDYDLQNRPESIFYTQMVGLIAKAIQELYAEFTTLKEEVSNINIEKNNI